MELVERIWCILHGGGARRLHSKFWCIAYVLEEVCWEHLQSSQRLYELELNTLFTIKQ